MRLNRRNFLTGIAMACLSILNAGGLKRGAGSADLSISDRNTKEKDSQQPYGYPPTVVSSHSARATSWDYASYPYVDSINQDIVLRMLNEALVKLTAENDATAAWKNLFSSYILGDKISIKPNFNDLYDEFRENLVVSPAVLNAVLWGLVEQLGVPPSDITIYDCTRIIPDSFRKRISHPVQYVEPFGSSFWRKVEYRIFGNPLPTADSNHAITMSHDVRDKMGKAVRCYMPRVLTQSQHLINVPLLKAHQFVSNSGSLKNHYGTIRFSDGRTGPEYLHPPLIHESIVDINSHDQIRLKTRLIVMDALFGRLKKNGGPPDRWQVYQNEGTPNRLLVARDPVALDSVAYEWLRQESVRREEALLSHDFLHVAETRGLGVHEHAAEDGTFRRIMLQEIEI